MSETLDRPELPFVGQSDADDISGDGVIWRSAINTETAGCEEFEFGNGCLEPGAKSRITPEKQFSEETEESVAMITAGQGVVTIDGKQTKVRPPDCLFVPADASYTFENTSSEDVEFLWGAATNEKSSILTDESRFDHDRTAQVIRPIHDVDANVTIEPRDTVRHWPAVFPETVGSEHLNVGLFQRPPGSSIKMHEHDPTTITEAFTVLDGTLLIRDHDGKEYILERGDFLYVPENGMHNNKNIGIDNILYACIETPARSRNINPMK